MINRRQWLIAVGALAGVRLARAQPHHKPDSPQKTLCDIVLSI